MTVGAAAERSVVRIFDRAGWGALRAPTSGSATQRALPDVLVGREAASGPLQPHHQRPWAIEVKATSAPRVYLTNHESDDLTAFAERFGAEPMVCAKFKSRGGTRTAYWFVPLANTREAGDSYAVDKDNARQQAIAVGYPPTANKDVALETMTGNDLSVETPTGDDNGE